MKKIIYVIVCLFGCISGIVQSSAFLAALGDNQPVSSGQKKSDSETKNQQPTTQKEAAQATPASSSTTSKTSSTTSASTVSLSNKSVQTSQSGPTTVLTRSVQVNPTVAPESKVVYMRNYSETGINKNTFLCHLGDGVSFEANDCSDAAILGAQGFNFVGGRTLQLFNNFAYWMKQKYKEQQYATISMKYDDAQTKSYLSAQGWGATNAYCILITTDPLMQQLVKPELQSQKGNIKVIAQLLYNGGGLVQLWSQDVVLVPIGTGFNVQVSNDADTDLKIWHTSQKYAQHLQDELKAIEKKEESQKKSVGKKSTDNQIQASKKLDSKVINSENEILLNFLSSVDLVPQSRMSDTYNNATDSPRKIRLTLVS